MADSKYKPFFSWNAEDNSDEGSQYFQPNDVRQLICYGLMTGSTQDQTELQIIYPCVGDPQQVPQLEKITFNGMVLRALSIAVNKHFSSQVSSLF